MPHTATYPSDALLGRYAEGRVSVSIAATPPCKSIIYNILRALSLAREGAMRRGCWASHVEGALSGGHYTLHTKQATNKLLTYKN